jgi:hypothetical protein
MISQYFTGGTRSVPSALVKISGMFLSRHNIASFVENVNHRMM